MQLRSRYYRSGFIAALALVVGLALAGGCPNPDDAPPPGSGAAPSVDTPPPSIVAGVHFGPAAVDGPTALPDISVDDVALAGVANSVVVVRLAASGSAGGVADFEIASAPEFGVLGPIALTGNMSARVEYTPPVDFVGPVTFTYRAIVGGIVSREAVVRITILPQIEFALSTTHGSSPLTLTMTALTVQGTSLPEGIYTWTVGDATSEGPVSTHASRTEVLTRAGPFAVGLTVAVATLSQPIVCRYEADKSTQAMVQVDEATVQIGGVVRGSGGAPLAGVLIVTGDGNHSAQSASGGQYAMAVPRGWSGTIAPVGAAQFEPAQRTYSNVLTDVSGQDFAQVAPQQAPGHLLVSIASTPTSTGPMGGPFTPSAHIFTLSNTGDLPIDWSISGGASWITISTLGGPLGADGSVTVSAAINANANSLAPGTYSQQLSFINQTNGAGGGTQTITLVVQPPTELVIAGRVTETDGTPLSGVVINGLPGEPITDENGDYAAVVAYGWSGTATPQRSGYMFTPANRTYAGVTQHLVNENYAASTATYTISGRVTDIGGTGMGGVVIGGLPGSPVTDANGDYYAAVNHGWSGTTTPGKAGYSFSPAGRTYSNVTANQANQNYTAATVTYTISGRVADGGGAGVSGVTIGGLPGNPTTDGNGDFSSTVVAGWSGTITPSKAGYSFLPSARTYSNVSNNQSGQNFTASLLSYTVSGRVVDGSGVPIAGVQLAGLPGDPTTDPNGNYSATVTHGWSGTATPTKADYSFVPASRTYTNVGGGQSEQDYTGTAAGAPQMAASISQYGITWTFDKSYRVGQFVTGDWWVAPDDPNGTVVVVSVNPAPTGSGSTYRNGSMINPTLGNNGDDQAYDGRVQGFSASLTVSYPVALSGGQSLVSTESIPAFPFNITTEPDPFPQVYRTQKTTVNGATQTALRNAAILTCLSAPPATPCFRPPFVGTAKPLYAASLVDLSTLPNLAAPGSTPSAAVLQRAVLRPWIDFKREWMANQIAPINNQVSYGRDVAYCLGEAALWLCLNGAPESKAPVAYGLIQIGIDHYYAAQLNGNMWETSGGYKIGRKLPILFAAKMLSPSPAWDISSVKFQEDMATYFGSDRTPAQTLWTGWATSGHPYASNVLYQFEEDPDTQGNAWDHEHVPPLGWNDAPFPNNPSSPQYPFHKHEMYRRLVSYAMVGQCTSARILGLRSVWAHEPYFAYVDRWMNEDDVAIRQAIAAAAAAEDWNSLGLPGYDFTNPAVYTPFGRAALGQFSTDMYTMYRPTN